MIQRTKRASVVVLDVMQRRIGAIVNERYFRAMRRRLVLFVLAAFSVLSLAASGAELKPWTGGAAPPFTLEDLAGKAHRLEEYKGRVLVVNFWATWCEPCRDEMPSLNRLKARMADAPFAILAIDMGEGEARVKAFLDKVPVDFQVLLDRDSAVTKAWKVRVLPTTLVLDPSGRIRYSAVGELDWSAPPIEKRLRSLVTAR